MTVSLTAISTRIAMVASIPRALSRPSSSGSFRIEALEDRKAKALC